MGRRQGNVEHGAYRVLLRVVEIATGEVVREYSEGPYATAAAAKGRMTWAKRTYGWHTRDKTRRVEVILQGIEAPEWNTMAVEFVE